MECRKCTGRLIDDHGHMFRQCKGCIHETRTTYLFGDLVTKITYKKLNTEKDANELLMMMDRAL